MRHTTVVLDVTHDDTFSSSDVARAALNAVRHQVGNEGRAHITNIVTSGDDDE